MCVVHWKLVPVKLKQEIHRHARDVRNGVKASAAELAYAIDQAAKSITSAEARAREAAGQMTMFGGLEPEKKPGGFHE
jgi:hypothetical protein